ncbi:MAG: TCR/Tet family MFS transporter [Sphingorhabdus sp.]|uniref:TCR/Tet family MFS transporter n=1 Tax=Sphingorhabdus sp. TaxID=1902408 RepID=UPI0038FC5C04
MIIDPASQKRAKRFILLTVFIYSAGFGIIMPVLPDLIRELTQLSLSEATQLGAWIGAAYGIFQFIMGPMMGNLGDRFGRRPVFLVSLFGFGVDFLLMGLAPSIIWLFVGRSIAGGFGAIFGPANAAMADMSSAEDRAASFGKVGAAFGLGFIIGPALGGFLGDYGTRLPFFVAAGLAFANGIYGYFVFPETMAKDRRRRFEWRRANPFGALANLGKIKGILPIAFIYFLWVCAINIYPSSFSFFAPAQFGWDSKMVGISLTLVGVSMLLFQSLVIGKVVKRFGERKTAMIGMAFGVTSFAITAFLTNGTIALVLNILNGFSGMAMPAINAMMSRRTPPNQQGELQGLNGSMSALAFLMAQLVYNNLLSMFTSATAPIYFPGAIFLVAASLGLVTLTSLFLLSRRDPETSMP